MVRPKRSQASSAIEAGLLCQQEVQRHLSMYLMRTVLVFEFTIRSGVKVDSYVAPLNAFPNSIVNKIPKSVGANTQHCLTALLTSNSEDISPSYCKVLSVPS